MDNLLYQRRQGSQRLELMVQQTGNLVIRAFRLRPGDMFIKMGTPYKVMSIYDGRIHFKNIGIKGIWNQMGARSQEWIEVIN
jgi:hypothetical protein